MLGTSHKEKKGSGFATNVTALKEGVIQEIRSSPPLITPVCFGCLNVGHPSKDGRSRLDCNVCHQNHPGVLPLERQGKGTSSEQVQHPVTPPSVSTTMFQTCGHIGADWEDDTIFSVVAVKVKSQRSNKTVQMLIWIQEVQTHREFGNKIELGR